MNTISREDLIRALDNAPQIVQDAATSPDTLQLIGSFQQMYGLHVDVVGKIAELNRNLLLGLTSPAEFLGELVLGGIDANTAQKIIAELNDKIFVPVQKQMREAGSAAAAPMSGPPTQRAASMTQRATPQLAYQAPPAPPMPVPPPMPQSASVPANLPGADFAIPGSRAEPLRQAEPSLPPMPAPAAVPTPIYSAPQPVRPSAPPAWTLPVMPAAVSAPPTAPRIPSSTPVSMPSAPPPPTTSSAAPTAIQEPLPPIAPRATPDAPLMWQTPVPPAWQSDIPKMTEPVLTEKPQPRTMADDMLAMQQPAQPSAAPSAYQTPARPAVQATPATAWQAASPEREPMPPASSIAPASPMPSIPQVSKTVPTFRPSDRPYIPPPARVIPDVPKVIGGDPYREPIEDAA